MRIDIDRHILMELIDNNRKFERSSRIIDREYAKCKACQASNTALLRHLVREGGVDDAFPPDKSDTTQLYKRQKEVQKSHH